MNQIIFTNKDWQEMTRYLMKRSDVESGAYSIYKTSFGPNNHKFLVTRTIIPEDKDYLKRSPVCVAFKPEFTEKALQMCEATNGHLLDLHTHPWASDVNFSSIDDREARLRKVPYMLRYVPVTNIAFVVLGKSPTVAKARFWDKSANRLTNIDRILVT